MASIHQPTAQQPAPKILLNSNTSSRNSTPLSTRFSSPTRIISPSTTKEFLKSNKPAYKSIKIDPDLNKINQISIDANLKHGVSFDTVAISYSEGGHIPHHEDDHTDERRGRSASPYRTRSPSSSPFRTRSPSPLDSNTFSGFGGDIDRLPSVGHFDGNGWRVDYPSESAIRNNAFTQNIKHSKYQEFIKEKIPRKFLIYLTGRQHTWIALDYVIAKILKNGDHLIISSRIPSSFTDEIVQRGDEDEVKKDEIDPKIFKNVSENILKYIKYIVDPSIIFQLTIDLFLSNSTVDILNESIEIYQPELIIASTKPNLRFQRVTSWKTSRLTDRLVKNFDVPIMVVPAFSLNEFEIEFFDELKHHYENTKHNNNSNEKLIESNNNNSSNVPQHSGNVHNGLVTIPSETSLNGFEDDKSEISSIISSSSELSDDSDDSNSSFQALTKTITNYNEILDHFAEDADETIINSTIFLEKLNKVSDISKRMALTFADFSNNEGEGGDLMRTLTGLPKLEKHKSMLDVFDTPQTEAISNIKKTLLTSNSPNNLQPIRSIKFQNETSPERIRIKKNTLADLKRFKTNIDQRPNSEIELNPVKSQPGITKMASESNVKTLGKPKKKGIFKSIFGR